VAKPVSQEVFERLQVRERFDCWNRDEMDLMLEPYAEDAVFDMSGVFTDSEPARGREAMLRAWHELRDTWGGGVRMDPIELYDLGDRRFVLDVRLWGKGHPERRRGRSAFRVPLRPPAGRGQDRAGQAIPRRGVGNRRGRAVSLT
jgi:ketosteroid isomerase-like protein